MFPTAHGVVSQGGAVTPPEPGACGGPLIYNAAGWAAASNLTQNLGQRFTVGASPITVCALRYYHLTGGTETVYLYRQSDGALLASAIVTSSGGWGETSISPVTLAANTDYVVSSFAAGASRDVYRNPSSFNIDPGVTRVRSVFHTTASMPSTASAQTYVHAGFRTQAPVSGYRFYRWVISANNGRGTIDVAEAQLRESIGGPNVATGGLPYATSVFSSSLSASAAFDGDSGTHWSSASGVTSAELWYDHGTGSERSVVQYALQARSNANDGSPRDWVFEGSNDLITWDTLDTVTGQTGWANGETRVFTL